jgi:hypothetical protein
MPQAPEQKPSVEPARAFPEACTTPTGTHVTPPLTGARIPTESSSESQQGAATPQKKFTET